MHNDTVQIATDSLMQVSQQDATFNWWMLIAIIEFIVLLAVLFKGKKRSDKQRAIKRQVKQEGDIDWNNTITSSFGAEVLYKELIRKCHPDRFAPNAEKMAIANDISERLGKYKYNLNELNKLKEEAINKLSINI